MVNPEPNPLDDVGLMRTAVSNLHGIEQILGKYDTFDVLAAFRYAENAIDPENYSESTHHGLGAAVEFVASIAAMKSYAPQESRQFEASDLKLLHDLSHSSIAIAQLRYLAKSDTESSEGTNLSWLASQMAINSMVVRGNAYPHHLKELLLELAIEVNPVIEESLGFNLSDSIAIDDAVFEYERRVGEKIIDDIEELRDHLSGYARKERSRESVIAVLGSESTLLDVLLDDGWEDVLDQFCDHYVLFLQSSTGLVSVQDLSNETGLSAVKVLAFIRAFSVQFGEIDADTILPSATSPFLKRPFIVCDQKFLRVNNDVYSYILPRIEQLVNPNGSPDAVGSQRQWERYHQKRDKYLERKVIALFRKVMPVAMIESSLSYPIQGEDSIATAELDCLVVHDNNFLFIEAKASAISESTRRGSTLKIQSDIRKGLGKGAQQAARAAAYVMSAERSVTFVREDGSELEIVISPIRNCFHVVVTLDHMDALFVNSAQLYEAGLIPETEMFWAIGIRDLIVFAEIIEFPTQLVHFIERRTYSLRKHRIFVADELDLLCFYLGQGLYFENIVEGPSANIHLASNTKQLDDYYYFERGLRETPTTKPRQELPERLRSLILCMEDSGLPAGSEAIRVFLSMSGKTREEFTNGIGEAESRCRETQTNRSIAMAIADYGITYFVFPLGEAAEMRSIVANYLKRKRADTGARHWVAICAGLENPYEICWCGVASASTQSITQ